MKIEFTGKYNASNQTLEATVAGKPRNVTYDHDQGALVALNGTRSVISKEQADVRAYHSAVFDSLGIVDNKEARPSQLSTIQLQGLVPLPAGKRHEPGNAIYHKGTKYISTPKGPRMDMGDGDVSETEAPSEVQVLFEHFYKPKEHKLSDVQDIDELMRELEADGTVTPVALEDYKILKSGFSKGTGKYIVEIQIGDVKRRLIRTDKPNIYADPKDQSKLYEDKSGQILQTFFSEVENVNANLKDANATLKDITALLEAEKNSKIDLETRLKAMELTSEQVSGTMKALADFEATKEQLAEASNELKLLNSKYDTLQKVSERELNAKVQEIKALEDRSKKLKDRVEAYEKSQTPAGEIPQGNGYSGYASSLSPVSAKILAEKDEKIKDLETKLAVAQPAVNPERVQQLETELGNLQTRYSAAEQAKVAAEQQAATLDMQRAQLQQQLTDAQAKIDGLKAYATDAYQKNQNLLARVKAAEKR